MLVHDTCCVPVRGTNGKTAKRGQIGRVGQIGRWGKGFLVTTFKQVRLICDHIPLFVHAKIHTVGLLRPSTHVRGNETTLNGKACSFGAARMGCTPGIQ